MFASQFSTVSYSSNPVFEASADSAAKWVNLLRFVTVTDIHLGFPRYGILSKLCQVNLKPTSKLSRKILPEPSIYDHRGMS